MYTLFLFFVSFFFPSSYVAEERSPGVMVERSPDILGDGSLGDQCRCRVRGPHIVGGSAGYEYSDIPIIIQCFLCQILISIAHDFSLTQRKKLTT